MKRYIIPVACSIIGGLLSFSSTAWSATCATGDAPSPFDAAACNVNNYGDVCQYRYDAGTGEYLWECDLERDQGARCGTGTVVVDYDGSSPTRFSAWGTTSQGTNFCCTETRYTDVVVLHGTDNTTYPPLTSCGDTLKFNHSSGSKNLGTNSTATPATLVKGKIFAGDGDDDLEGSYDSDYSTYREYLYGEGYDDVIDCWDGQDYAEGGIGADEISGGDDDDQLWGGDGKDTICGGSGADDLYGEGDDDILDGGGQVLDYKHGGGRTYPYTTYGNECDAYGTNVACTTVPIQSSYTCP